MIDHAGHFPNAREPDFYLTRLLGPKLAVLVVLLVLYLSVRHQLISRLDASTLNLGLAHAEASVKLALFDNPDTITRFSRDGGTYDFNRHTIAHADLFAECWRAVLRQIERGVVAAVLFIAAPPIAWFIGCTGWELWCESRPQPVPIPQTGNGRPVDDISLREVPPPPLNRFEPEFAEEVIQETDGDAAAIDEAAPIDGPVLPTAVPRKRTRKAKTRQEIEPQNVPPTPPLVQPGQVRRRPKKEE